MVDAIGLIVKGEGIALSDSTNGSHLKLCRYVSLAAAYASKRLISFAEHIYALAFLRTDRACKSPLGISLVMINNQRSIWRTGSWMHRQDCQLAQDHAQRYTSVRGACWFSEMEQHARQGIYVCETVIAFHHVL